MKCSHYVRRENLLQEIMEIGKFFIKKSESGEDSYITFKIPLKGIVELEIDSMDEDSIECFHKNVFLNREYEKRKLQELLIRFKDQIAIQEIEENGKEMTNGIS